MYYVYSLSDDEVLGPYSLSDLVTFITPGILVCDINGEDWQYAEEIPEIKELLIELGLLQTEIPDGYTINEFGEIVKKELPNFRVNSSGEIIRNNQSSTNSTRQTNNTSTYQNDTNINTNEKKNYFWWWVLVIIIILIIIAANDGFD